MKQYKNKYEQVIEDYGLILLPLFFYIGMVITLSTIYLIINL